MSKTIHTNLSLSQLENRFDLFVIRDSLSGYCHGNHNKSSFMGNIKNNKIRIFYHRAYVGNSFTIFLTGKITETNSGCNIEYRCGKNPIVLLITAIWLAFAIFAFISVLSLPMHGNDWFALPITSVFVIIGMLLLFYTPKNSVRSLESILKTIADDNS